MPARKPRKPTQKATKAAQRAAVAAAEEAERARTGTLDQLAATALELDRLLGGIVSAMVLAGMSEAEAWAMIDDAAERRPPAAHPVL